MLDLMKCTSNSRVLDMGCGKGQACVDVARKCGAEVTGLDLSTSNIKRARELQQENPDLKLHFLEGSITALPTELKVRPFTHIMSVQAWVHVHSALETVLAEARSVLEPGGIVVVEDFCSNDAGVISDQALRHFYKRLHFDSVMSPATWRSKAEAAGFQVEHWEDLRDHMAESYRLMAASAKEHGLRSADGTCLDENYLNTMDIELKKAILLSPEASSGTRPKCKFGEKCYRKNPDHRREMSHPGDTDWEVPEDNPPESGEGEVYSLDFHLMTQVNLTRGRAMRVIKRDEGMTWAQKITHVYNDKVTAFVKDAEDTFSQHPPGPPRSARTVQLEAPQQPEPARQVFVEEQPQGEIGEGAASGAPDPTEEQPSETLREDLEEAEEEEEEPNERSRSEPPKQRPKFPRESPTSRPLGLRPRVAGYPEIWALIAPAPPAPVTTLVGAKSSRRVNPSPKPGVEPKLTRSQWTSGPNTQFYHLDEEESEGTSSEELIPASDDHRSTSSDPPSVLPKRTSSQAYSHSPPPTSREVPRSRFHQPKRVQSPRQKHQPLQGTVEAPAFEDRVRRPEPPPPKKSRIEFGARTVASGPSSSSRQLPISPPARRTGQQGAASPEAHRPPSFGAPSLKGEIKQGETIRVSSASKVKVKAFPAKAYPKADLPSPPPPQPPLEPRKKSPPEVAKRAGPLKRRGRRQQNT
eukprot:symbB.v1.2.033470.t1/scaffold4163.1/size45672/1